MKFNRRVTDIADSVIEKRDRKCKYKLQSLMQDKYNQIKASMIIINFHSFHQIMYNCITGIKDGNSIIEIIDIKEPLRNLKNKLEARLKIDLTDYDFYLQGTQ